MTFTVDLTDTRLFSGLYETIWLNYESLSEYVHKDDALIKEEAEKLTTEELFNLVDSAEFYNDDDDKIYLVVKEVSYA